MHLGSHWEPVLTAPPRKWTAIVFHSQGNLHLACQSLVERLVTEINDLPDGGSLGADNVAYGLVKNLVATRAAGRPFRFRILSEGEEILLSPEYS